MHPLDWTIVAVYIVYVSWDGIRRSRNTREIEGYFLANRNLPWWAVGLSVMATQLSAVTMIGTTGQGATDGIRFIQFYFGLPIAMVILGVTLVKLLHNARVFTAYEYLERRFDPKTRSLTSFLFLVSRGLSCGAIIAAPAVVFSSVLGWNIYGAVAILGIPTVIYTMIGGVQAVTWADVKQMFLIVFAIVVVLLVVIIQLPVNPHDALRIAGATGKMQAFDFSFDLTKQYTFWSGAIAGTFLMMSYFGTDQSQAQRYLTAKSVDEARSSLLMSAFWKIPLQVLILLIGVFVFVFYLFQPAPLLFNSAHEQRVRAERPAIYQSLNAEHEAALQAQKQAALQLARSETAQNQADFERAHAAVGDVRKRALDTAAEVTGQSSRDVNYIMPRFVLHELPIGLIGIFIAAVMAAAMSSIAAELNSLATATVIDFYRRWVKPVASDQHYLRVSKASTAFWGLFACIVATYAASGGSLIEVVNRYGSFFYGSILGVFLLAMIPRARAAGAFWGLIAGMTAVGATSFGAPQVAFLWYNVIGAGTVLIVGLMISMTAPNRRAGETS